MLGLPRLSPILIDFGLQEACVHSNLSGNRGAGSGGIRLWIGLPQKLKECSLLETLLLVCSRSLFSFQPFWLNVFKQAARVPWIFCDRFIAKNWTRPLAFSAGLSEDAPTAMCVMWRLDRCWWPGHVGRCQVGLRGWQGSRCLLDTEQGGRGGALHKSFWHLP